ncbi:hypothetical protein [Streptosporangium sp. KLBMP 9127]|nr:hypothetical protein [Streptosporangium sp. KLBMP 9127]
MRRIVITIGIIAVFLWGQASAAQAVLEDDPCPTKFEHSCDMPWTGDPPPPGV